jgi:DNA-directed RNA polymerase subunit RPC12/RpoP
VKGRLGSLPCVLCGRLLQQREDKNGKPYFVCDECGVQLFVRGPNGRERLIHLLSRSNHTPSNKLDIERELDCLHANLEEFCTDELVIPPGSSRIEDAVPFVEWSRLVLDRVLAELNQPARKR